jgi:hypothetical protein
MSSTTAEPVAVSVDRARWWQRRGRIFVAVAAAVVVLAGGLTTLGVLRHLDHQYGPIQGGSGYGTYSDRGFVSDRNGLSYHLSETPGATARLIAFLDNRGAHSVKITSIENGDMVRQIRWSVYRVVNGGSAFGVATAWHAFPAIVPAHGSIRLLITLQHPSNCSAYPKYRGVRDVTYTGGHLVHWESLLHKHTSLVEVMSGAAAFDEGIRVC